MGVSIRVAHLCTRRRTAEAINNFGAFAAKDYFFPPLAKTATMGQPGAPPLQRGQMWAARCSHSSKGRLSGPPGPIQSRAVSASPECFLQGFEQGLGT